MRFNSASCMLNGKAQTGSYEDENYCIYAHLGYVHLGLNWLEFSHTKDVRISASILTW